MSIFQFILLLSLVSISSSQLIVYLSTSNESKSLHGDDIIVKTLPASFSTLGPRLPDSRIISSIVLVSTINISNTCQFQERNIFSNLVVFTDPSLPSLHGCTRAGSGRVAAFARACQKYEAAGAIIPAQESV